MIQDNEELRKSMEMLFYAYRDFTEVANRILEEHSLGRAHHRVIYFVRQYPDMTVKQILDILKITKQSLNRVLSKLIENGFIVQNSDPKDRRKRLLNLTSKGIILEADITNAQANFIAKAHNSANMNGIDSFKKIPISMIDKGEQERV